MPVIPAQGLPRYGLGPGRGSRRPDLLRKPKYRHSRKTRARGIPLHDPSILLDSRLHGSDDGLSPSIQCTPSPRACPLEGGGRESSLPCLFSEFTLPSSPRRACPGMVLGLGGTRSEAIALSRNKAQQQNESGKYQIQA